MIQYADIVYDTIVDGIGLRNTLYVCGCPHNCEGCHNKPLQDYNCGKQLSIGNIVSFLVSNNDNDITFSGGEPFEQALWLKDVASMCKIYHTIYYKKHLNIWVYSGYTFEEIILDPIKLDFLKQCDVLVDGKFEIDKRDTTLKFRGSSNQRVIDVQKSLAKNRIIELEI